MSATLVYIVLLVNNDIMFNIELITLRRCAASRAPQAPRGLLHRLIAILDVH